MNTHELLELYRLVLNCEPRHIYDSSPTGDLGAQLLGHISPRQHARWMLDNMPAVKDSDVYTEVPEELAQTVDGLIRFNRWLGFVQAILWMTGEYTLDQLRAHVREATSGDSAGDAGAGAAE